MKLPYEEQAIAMYTAGVKNKRILEELNISNGQLYNVLKKNGIELRAPQKAKGKNGNKDKTKKCPICKAHNNPLNAKFCCMCGADIRSETDILTEKLDKAMTTCIRLLPTNATEDVIDAMRQASAFIKRSVRK